MDREKFLKKLFPLIGGKENTSLCEFQDDILYVTLKDASLANENAVAKLPDAASVTLRRGRLTITFGEPERKEEVPHIMANGKNYDELARRILELIGGKENVTFFAHCITRLRFQLHNKEKAKLDELKNLKGVLGAQWSGEQLQIIIGAEVADVYAAVCKVGDLNALPAVEQKTETKKKWSVNTLFETLSACMVPVLPALCGTGVIKGVLVLLTTYLNVSTENSVYVLLNTVADTAFYFMPFLVAYAASNRFKVNTIVALMMTGLFLHPTITAMAGTDFNVLGVNMHILNYSSTVFPALISVWILSYVYKIVDRILPKVLRFVLTPSLSLIIMAPICLGLIGPLGYNIGYYLATGVSKLFYLNAYIGGFVLGVIRPFVLLPGMQTTFTPIILNNLSTYGYDFIWPVHSVFSMACCGMCIGAFLRARKETSEVKDEKDAFISAFVSGFAGVSEPALYSIAFRFKSQLVALILSSSISGAFVAGMGAKVYAAGNPPWLFLAGFGETMGLMAIGFILSFVLGMIFSYAAGFTNTIKFAKKESK